MALDHQIRYLEGRLAGCVPASIHTEQIAAYSAAAGAAHAAGDDGPGFQRATNNLLEITRAEWIDRYQTAARLYDSLGDRVRAEICRENVEAARGPTDHGGLISAMIATKVATAPRREGIEDSANRIPALVSQLVALRLERGEPGRRERRLELEQTWQALHDGDPDFTAESLASRPIYRARLPFGDAGVAALIRWIEDLGLATVAPAPRPTPPAPPPIEIPAPGESTPTADEVAAGYRAAAAAVSDAPELEPLRAAYQRIDELARAAPDGMALLADMAAEDLFTTLARAPLVAAARSARGELDDGQVATAAHLDRLIADLEAARSIAEIEIVGLAADEHLAVESAWSQILFSIALRSSITALLYSAEPTDACRAQLAESEAIAIELLGGCTATILAQPPIWQLFEREVFGRGQTPPIRLVDPQAWYGELVLDAAARARNALIQWAVSQHSDDPAELARLLSGRRFATAAAMRDHILAEIAATGGTASGAPDCATPPAPLVMWGASVELANVVDALARPPRPPLPL